PSVDVPLFATGGDTFNALNFAAVLGDGGPPLAGTTDPADPTFITDALVLDGSLFETPTVDLAANGLVRVLALDPAAPLPGELLAAQVAADAAPGETPTNVDGLFTADGLLLTLRIDVSNMTAGDQATLITGGILGVPNLPDIPNSFTGGNAGPGIRPTFPTIQLQSIPEPNILALALLATASATQRKHRRHPKRATTEPRPAG
ncbi:MAG: hypothetical protein AAF663_01375, partial [Planctomycetota bacterium]